MFSTLLHQHHRCYTNSTGVMPTASVLHQQHRCYTGVTPFLNFGGVGQPTSLWMMSYERQWSIVCKIIVCFVSFYFMKPLPSFGKSIPNSDSKKGSAPSCCHYCYMTKEYKLKSFWSKVPPDTVYRRYWMMAYSYEKYLPNILYIR